MTNKSQKLLSNVVVIRVILVVLLVFYHAFAPYSGAWEPIEGFPKVPFYWWLDKLSYAFMLETFVFISGYVFGYQVRTKGEDKLKARKLFGGKFKRLIIPCMVFSLLYILLFGNINQPIVKTLYGVVGGVGHMWFLPMLFWCFVGVWIIEKLQIRSVLVLTLLLLCSICSFIPLPLQMGAAMYYLVFFYVGYFLQRKEICLERYYRPGYALALLAIFAIAFPILTIFREEVQILNANVGGGDNQFFAKLITLICTNIARMIYSSIGLAMLFVTVGMIEKKREAPLPKWILTVGNLCMGVYLLQQFILLELYYKTTLPQIINPILLPWVCFIITLVATLLFSYLMRLTKLGKFLIG